MNNHISEITLHPHNYPTKKYYPFSLPVFNQTEQITFQTPITFFVGENGTGKSTLLKAIARAAHIHIWGRDNGTRYDTNKFEKLLYRFLSINWTQGKIQGAYFGSEIFNDFRQIIEEWITADPGQIAFWGGKSLISQSHGQAIMSYFRNRYKIPGIYFLDEPETALSPTSQIELLDILRENATEGHAQFIIATHSPILLSYQGATIYSFDHTPLKALSYKETAHYKIYRKLLDTK